MRWTVRHGHKNDDSRRRRTEVGSSSRIRQRLSQYESGGYLQKEKEGEWGDNTLDECRDNR